MCHPMWAHWRHLANTIEIVYSGATCRIRLNLCFLRSTQVHNPYGRSIGSAVSAELTAESPYKSLYFTMGDSFPKNCPFPCGSGPQSNTWFPGPIRVLNSNCISIGSAVFAGSLVLQTDRQTDRPRYSVGNNMQRGTFDRNSL